MEHLNFASQQSTCLFTPTNQYITTILICQTQTQTQLLSLNSHCNHSFSLLIISGKYSPNTSSAIAFIAVTLIVAL